MKRRRTVSSLAELRLAIGRKGLPLRQTELAERAGVQQGYVSQIERGIHRPSQFVLARIAYVYSIPIEQVRAAAAETLRRAKAGKPQIRTDF